MGKIVKLDDNAINILEQEKEEMRQQGIEKVTYSEAIRHLARQIDKSN